MQATTSQCKNHISCILKYCAFVYLECTIIFDFGTIRIKNKFLLDCDAKLVGKENVPTDK